VECSGANGQPRNGKNGATCSANSCKMAYARKRKSAASPAAAELPADDAATAVGEMMPAGMWVYDLTEILGERCCELRLLSHKKRKNGPGGASYCQQYLVRGMFLEEDGDEDDEDDAAPEPNTFWVNKVDLLETIAKEDIRKALVARHESVLEDL